MLPAVVVSTWVGNPPDYLRRLCSSMRKQPAGVDYRLFLSANGLDYEIPPDLKGLFHRVFIRENRGFNLGAWDHAWRHLPDHDFFLFLQDDCRVIRRRWLQAFLERFHQLPRCGLLGENLNRNWDREWSALLSSRSERSDRGCTSPSPVSRRARFYRETLERWRIPPGRTARHLTAVVHFTSRAVLEEVGGYDLADNYEEAIAAEIAISRKIEASGHAIAQVGARRHSRIAHREWPREGRISGLLGRILKRSREHPNPCVS